MQTLAWAIGLVALPGGLTEAADPFFLSLIPRGSGVLLEGELVDVSRHSILDAHDRKVRMLPWGTPAGDWLPGPQPPSHLPVLGFASAQTWGAAYSWRG